MKTKYMDFLSEASKAPTHVAIGNKPTPKPVRQKAIRNTQKPAGVPKTTTPKTKIAPKRTLLDDNLYKSLMNNIGYFWDSVLTIRCLNFDKDDTPALIRKSKSQKYKNHWKEIQEILNKRNTVAVNNNPSGTPSGSTSVAIPKHKPIGPNPNPVGTITKPKSKKNVNKTIPTTTIAKPISSTLPTTTKSKPTPVKN